MSVKLRTTSDYSKMTLEEALQALNVTKDGLTEEETAKRIRDFGYNEITEKKNNPVLGFLKRYWGPMPWLLELSIALTIILNHYVESVIIFVLLTMNAVIGFLQSNHSQKAVSMLKKKLEINAKVLRDGKWVLLQAKDLVPGDIINVKFGDLIPADAYIVNGEASVNESSLTGESLPKDVHAGQVVYSSSMIKSGEIKCLIVNTGAKTFFGKTVELVKIANPKSKQAEIMFTIVKYLLYIGIIASVIVAGYSIYLHKDVLFIISFVAIFLIGAIPVALPAVLTIVQAVGATELSKHGALVTKLTAIEDAASIDIFCFDKTGTITQNKLSVVDAVSFEDHQVADVVFLARMASQSRGMDAIDLAIIDYANKTIPDIESYKRVSYAPFSPATKRTEAVVIYRGQTNKIIKGAVDTIAALCAHTSDLTQSKLKVAVETFSKKGSRTIAIAIGKDDTFELVGVLAVADPPREDSKRLITDIKNLGIRCLMLTGDSVAIASEIASEVGIGGRIRPIAELNALSHDEQLKLINESDGFAGVFPEDKYKIVKLLQESGHMVGMTGDGANDSPALKQAELGTAVSDATDVAKASASVVLMEPGLSAIVGAIKISRETYQRMLTWVINKVIKVIEVVILLMVGFFWLNDMVISILGMSLLVFANDFVTMSIATDNVTPSAKPNQWDVKNITAASLILGIFFALEDLLIVFIGKQFFNLGLTEITTLVLLSLVFNTQFRILIVRERRHFWSSIPNKFLLLINISAIILFVLLGIFGLVITPVSMIAVFITLGLSVVFAVVIDFLKFFLFKKLKI